jgi:hypothetical protein
MRLTVVCFPLLIATLPLQAQTVSSISTGNPGCAIIEGNIVDEGKSFNFKGATYTVKKITANAVTVVGENGQESLLQSGEPSKNRKAKQTETPTTDAGAVKVRSRDEIREKFKVRQTKADVLKFLGKPTRTRERQEDVTRNYQSYDEWIYSGVSRDSTSGKIDSYVTMRFYYQEGREGVGKEPEAFKVEFEP